MAAPVQHLYLPAFSKQYSSLERCIQHPDTSAARTEFDAKFDWLLSNFSKFAAPSQASKDIINSKAPLWIAEGRELQVDASLIPATLQMSQLLALDEVQTHILLKRWRSHARSDLNHPPPLDKDGHLVVDPIIMHQVQDYYFVERASLIRCLSLLLETMPPSFATAADGQERDPSPVQQYVQRLLDGGLAASLLGALRCNLEGWALPMHQQGGGGHTPQAAQHTTALDRRKWTMPPSMLDSFREQLSGENRELLGLLLLVYSRWRVACSSEQLVELTQLLRHYVFQGSLTSAAAGVATSNLAVKAMATAALLSAMGLDRLLGLLKSGARLTPDVLPAAARTRDLDAELRNWHVSPAAVPVLLTWSAVVQLLGWSSRTDAGSEENQFQRDAFEAGGFDAWTSLLQEEVFEPSMGYAIAAREVMLTALNVVNTAYALSALTLEAGLLESVLRLVSTLVADVPDLCNKFWDEDDVCGVPMRSLLQDCTAIFPAFYWPLVRLLAAVSSSPAAAFAADEHLRSIPAMAWLHDKSDPGIDEHMGAVEVLHPQLLWSQAPSVPYLAVPQGTTGDVQPLPELAAGLAAAGNCWLVRWAVNCSFGVGQLVLGARALQCVISLREEATHQRAHDPELLRDLHDTIRLLCNIACNSPSGPIQLAQLLLATNSSYDLISLCSDAISVLLQRARPLGSVALDTMAHCLYILQQLMEPELGRVMGVLGVLPLLAATQVEPMPQLLVGQLASVQSVVPGSLGVEMSMLRALQSELETKQQEYPVTRAFLSLLKHVLDKGVVTGPVSSWVLYALHGVLGEHHKWQYKCAGDKWSMATAALRVLHAALLAGARFPGPSVARGSIAQVVEEQGNVQVTHLAATVIHQMCFHGCGYLAHLVLVLADVNQAPQHLSHSDVAAARVAADAFLRLIPMLLSASTRYPSPTPLERFWFVPLDASGTTPVRMLTSYLAHSSKAQRPLSRLSVLAMQAVHAIAATAVVGGRLRGAGAPPAGLSVAMLAPSGLSEKEGSNALRAALMQPWEKSSALSSHSDMLTATVDLLEATLEGHPALLDALLFPPPSIPPADPSAPKLAEGAAGSADPAGSKAAGRGPAGKKGAAALGPQSTLEAIWQLLQEAQQLWLRKPDVLADVLRAVCLLWRNADVAGAAVAELRSHAQFWTCLGTVLQAAAADTDAAEQPLLPSRIQCEMYVLQLMLMEFHANPRPAATSTAPAPADTAPFWHLMEATCSQELLGALLQRYRRTLQVPADWPMQLLCQLQGVCLDATAYTLDCARQGIKYTDLKLIAQDLEQECQAVLLAVKLSEADVELIKGASHKLLNWDRLAPAPGLMPYTASDSPAQRPAEVGGGGQPPNPVLAALPGMQLGMALLQMILAGDIGFASRKYGRQYLLDSSKLHVLWGHVSERMDRLVDWVDILNGAVANSDAGCDALATLCTLMAIRPRDKGIAAAMARQVVEQPGSVPASLDSSARELNLVVVQFMHSLSDPRMRLARVQWGLYALHVNLLEAIQQMARCLLQGVRVWQEACSSAPPTAAAAAAPAASGAGGSAPAAPWCEVCCNIVGLLKLWLRGAGIPTVTDSAPDGPMAQITACLLSCALMSLPPTQTLLPTNPVAPRSASPFAGGPTAPPPSASDLRVFQRLLLDLLPELCLLSCCPGAHPLFRLGGQLLARCLQLTAPSEWLPLLRAHLDVGALIRQLAACLALTHGRQEARAGQDTSPAALAPLQLLTVIASCPEGSALLQQQGVMQFACSLAQRLLVPGRGGMLAGATEQMDTDDVKGGGDPHSQPPDYAQAYTPHGAGWSPVHQLWCSVLDLVGCMMKGLQGAVQQLESSWMSFLLISEPRLLLACQPPAADPYQPLTRASVTELERALRILLQLSPCQGTWLYHLPHSLLHCRTALTSYIKFVAHHGGQKGAALVCPPCSLQEKRDAGLVSPFPATAGLYQACHRGATAPPPKSAGAHLALPGPAPSPPAASSTPRCSVYSAQLARGMYTSLLHALLFLLATSPPSQAPHSAAWPPSPTLLSVLNQVMSVLDALLEPGQPADRSGQRLRACVHLLRILQVLPELLAVSGCVLDRSMAERRLELVHKTERLCSLNS